MTYLLARPRPLSLQKSLEEIARLADLCGHVVFLPEVNTGANAARLDTARLIHPPEILVGRTGSEQQGIKQLCPLEERLTAPVACQASDEQKREPTQQPCDLLASQPGTTLATREGRQREPDHPPQQPHQCVPTAAARDGASSCLPAQLANSSSPASVHF